MPPKVVGQAKTRLKAALEPRVELVKSELRAVVNQLQLTENHWLAATSIGLYQSVDQGKTWRGGPVEGQRGFVAVASLGDEILAVSHQAALLSRDGGKSWNPVSLPSYVTGLDGTAIADNGVLWLATREGALRSDDDGVNWTHVLAGLPARHLVRMEYQPGMHRLLAVAENGDLFTSVDQGQSWQRKEAGFAVRSLAFAPGRLLAATAFDGVISESEPSVSSAINGGNQ